MHPSLHISRARVDATSCVRNECGRSRKSGGCNPFRLASLGVEGAKSDWDLLCVGSRNYRKSASLDLVYVSPEARRDSRMAGSELASRRAVRNCTRWFIRVEDGDVLWRRSVAAKSSRITHRAECWTTDGRTSLVYIARSISCFCAATSSVCGTCPEGSRCRPSPVLDREYEYNLSCA